MIKKYASFLLTGLLVYAGSTVTRPEAFAQTKKTTEGAGPETATKELVNEVRLLRQAFERSQQLLARLLSVTTRWRAQQEVVLQLTRDLAETRRQLAELKFNPGQLAEQLAEMEKKVAAGTTNAAHYRELMAEVEHQMQRERELRNREGELAAQLKTERAKLDDLNRRLDALERDIAR
jgi:chromosome segregation ATPase